MDGNRLQNHFFFALLLGVLLTTALIFLPYLSVLVLAAVLGVIFAPLNRRVRAFCGNRQSVAALVTLIIIVLVVLTPLFLVTVKISYEVRDLYVSLSEQGGSVGVLDTLSATLHTFAVRLLPAGVEPSSLVSLDLTSYLKGALQFTVSHLDTFFSKAASTVFKLFLLLIALYYTLRDGSRLKKYLIEYSPLIDADDEQISKKLELAVNSVVKGSLTIGVIQGTLTGIGFALFGVPNPALWGILAVITSLIPGVGTSLVLVPGIIYLFVVGHTGAAVGLIIWAVLAVGLIDNLLGPYLMERGIKIHPFLILLSVIGGLGFFGPIGFIMGPLVLSLLFALLELYKIRMLKRQARTQ